MRLRIIICHILLLCMSGVLSAQKEYVGKTDKLSVHPRILLPKGEEKELKKQIRCYMDGCPYGSFGRS